MLGDKRFLRSIRLRNILSFGPETEELELKSLNVLIGPNGSGKSNLIDAISLLQAAPRNLFEPIQQGGGIAEWLWKGRSAPPLAEIGVTVPCPPGALPDVHHQISITMVGLRAVLVEERIWDVLEIYGYRGGEHRLRVKPDVDHLEITGDVRANESILSQRKDPQRFPEITYLGSEYGKIRLFREWGFGRNTPPRKPQPPDLPSDFLEEDGANISLVLNDFEQHKPLGLDLLASLRDADESIESIFTRLSGGSVQPYVHYKGLQSPVPATRLSEGTIRYLCLLAILLHPSPPPLVCIEEPELGMHPDLLPKIAKLLIDASHRMQLIVTTHSDILVDALTEVPEAVVVCEKHEGSTTFRRLSKEDLAHWLKAYGEGSGLGRLWLGGTFGGTRW